MEKYIIAEEEWGGQSDNEPVWSFSEFYLTHQSVDEALSQKNYHFNNPGIPLRKKLRVFKVEEIEVEITEIPISTKTMRLSHYSI